MLDGRARQLLDPTLDKIAKVLVRTGIHANTVTLAGFAIGILAAIAIAYQYYIAGLILLLLSRLGDGLDGAVAKQTVKTDFGGYLDIVLDFAFYGMIPAAFVFANPEANALAGAVLILSFYVTGSSFLAYAIMAEKHGLKTTDRGSKSLYFVTGLAEATETIIVFVLFCLFPQWFAPIAWVYAAICFYTALAHILQARRRFKD
ncbi:MAG: CDP-alcohol phosphatidyltransferase family protein [Rhizobiaceae bacterium]|nr:CDP-alcohol phosphatidyltransferase family protein [Rhizobiaceae bacterium]